MDGVILIIYHIYNIYFKSWRFRKYVSIIWQVCRIKLIILTKWQNQIVKILVSWFLIVWIINSVISSEIRSIYDFRDRKFFFLRDLMTMMSWIIKSFISKKFQIYLQFSSRDSYIIMKFVNDFWNIVNIFKKMYFKVHDNIARMTYLELDSFFFRINYISFHDLWIKNDFIMIVTKSKFNRFEKIYKNRNIHEKAKLIIW